MDTIGWGIVGCGGIARQFAEGLATLADARLVVVAARDLGRAQDFAQHLSSEGQQVRAVDEYAAVWNDAEVDVVYIATTHQNHVALAKAAIAAGKAVLVEKPVGLHASEVKALIDQARDAGVFLMEAMWMRFIPAFRRLQADLQAGVIGPPCLIQADFGIAIDSQDPRHRMLDPSLGGGALWDLGIYPLTFARVLFADDPLQVHSDWIPAAETGVDEMALIQARYPGNRLAQLSCGFRLRVPHQGRIIGPQGRIVIDDFFHPQGYTIERHGQEPQHVKAPFTSTGYQFEAAEVQRCLRAGLTESPDCPLDETAAIISCMDDLVQSWGLRYPASS